MPVRKCIFKNCKTRPSYNHKGKHKADFCGKHKLEGMIDVISKTCIFENCRSQPAFNLEGLKAEYCGKHKLKSMVNVKSKPCKFEGCKTIPHYNYDDKTKGEFCLKHKLEAMVNVMSKTCIYENCRSQPTYNYEGKTTAEFCLTHKLEDMINVRDKTCKFEGCKTIPIYNYEGKTNAEFCTKHKLESMIDVKHKTCNFEGCKTIPNYNYKGKTKGEFCSSHKLEGMVNVVNKTCLTPYCEILPSNKNYEGYCSRCFMYTFPDKPMARNYKTKEKTVEDFILEQIPEVDWVFDKRVMDGCSKRRPDLLVDLGEQVVIVEVDENQHEDYDCSCENKRLMELSQDLGHRPLILIRFNPDSYTDKEGNKIKSCWKVNKLGVCCVDNDKKWKDRLNTLKETIYYWVENRTDKTIEVVHLFYDNTINV